MDATSAFDGFDRAEGSHHRQVRAPRSIAGGLAEEPGFWAWRLEAACGGLPSSVFFSPDGERGVAPRALRRLGRPLRARTSNDLGSPRRHGNVNLRRLVVMSTLAATLAVGAAESHRWWAAAGGSVRASRGRPAARGLGDPVGPDGSAARPGRAGGSLSRPAIGSAGVRC